MTDILIPAASAPSRLEALPAEIAFLEGFGIARAALVEAATLARGSGVTAERALLAVGALTAEAFYRLLARHLGIVFMDEPLAVSGAVPVDEAMELEIARLAPNARDLLFAIAPRGLTLRSLLERFGPDRAAGPGLHVAITTPRRLAALVRRRHRDDILRDASHGLADRNPRLSARAGLSPGQRLFGFAAGFAVAFGFGYSPPATFEALCLALSVLFLGMVGVRLLATVASRIPAAPLRPRRPDDELPVYTVVVALYRERRIVPQLVAALSRLDYPSTRLDIKLVLEADDHDTLEALEAERLPDCCEVLLAPMGRPRTKPRALNMALRFAQGRHLVIYDAEDVPEPGQLREAVDAFAAADPSVGCLQARLAIDNERDSWLTRLFAIEYASLFDVINPGLARLGLPVPLGGTSNHFRIEALRDVHGWDAWNVTEDVDLGIRLARAGYGTAMLASTTFEEAPVTLRAWLGQRRRWQKGWMVTLKTHTRNPARLFAEIGLPAGIAAYALLAGTLASSLLWPFCVVLLGVDAAFGSLLAPVTAAEKAWSALALTVGLSGMASLLWPGILGLRRRGLLGSAAWLGLLPVYLAVLCRATWGALVEVALRPHSWTKTEHGLALRRARGR